MEILSHSELRLSDPEGWVLRLAHRQPRRLVVFVHGFGGAAVSTWQRFPEVAGSREWWTRADMLFVAYNSKRDNITGAATRLRERLSALFPALPPELLNIDGVRVREEAVDAYAELVLVGHSLGGLIVRRALCDMASSWKDAGFAEPKPAVLAAARVSLFSPASAGFRPAGMAGMAHATPLWWVVNIRLRRSSAFTDMTPGSEVLTSTRRRTEDLARTRADLVALRPQILWANPDDIVITERYDTDPVDHAVDGQTHRSVCKPSASYQRPVLFVEGVA